MSRLSARIRLTAALAGALVVAVVGTTAAVAPPASAAPAGSVTINGRGWGHGRGMGQFGALGYAVNQGWSTEQILAHFYGGTTLDRNAGNPEMTVELMAHTDREIRVSAPAVSVNGGQSLGNVTVRVVRSGTSLRWYTGTGCTAGSWTDRGTVTGPLTISTASTSDPARMLRLCEPGFASNAATVYRGSIVARLAGGRQFAVNVLPTEEYLRGVVPREMPASWANQGGGRGAAALRAQAVAARSFARSSTTPRASGALTCDTTSCQVYGGAAFVNAAGTLTSREHPLSDQAIAATAGWVMRRANRTIARTEYSSSTGGFTAGGDFPAVEDAGDSIASNPNHTWTATLTAVDVASRLGVRPITDLRVTGRNGLGAYGGRVTQVVVTSDDGSTRTFTGGQMRTALGLRSDWFTVDGSFFPPPPGPQTGDSFGTRRGNRFALSNTFDSSRVDLDVAFGRVGDMVLVGDWNADRRDTFAIRRGNRVFLSNTFNGGNAEVELTFGRVGDTVLVGDWNGDGRDTLAIRRGNRVFLSNTFSGGNAEVELTFGRVTDTVLAGDWNGDGRDTLAIRRGTMLYLSNRTVGGAAEIAFMFGDGTGELVVGDWDGR